ncbi:hypothetical protein PTSG_10254 [Salpingoeca rosetta]|uniref:Serine hydrolase FSH domain-containing protein n=1 Tax=Salpingoeca rosetta (strain ATCC 50818 / BSB-021) TaxID=946362 RepID=F2UQR7_SALR5|nr:uncharacterized protein PTSG_10254 [Salpingoeca rosetta]EGD79972.1 hypothetical protein PTSG_10254 [Salpingoeca rosetta]|eukprot:XP_004988593.1 hypothetical protein PTSG_10254 [Salpingoeca rosetta]
MAHVAGVLHCGQMGAAVAAVLRGISEAHPDVVKDVIVTLEGRSEASRERATAAGVRVVASLDDLCKEATMLVSIVPPAHAMDVAKACIAHGFRGLYCDMNAVASTTSRQIGRIMHENECVYVDGAVLGPPPRSQYYDQQQSQQSSADQERKPPLIALAGKDTGEVERVFALTDAVRVKVVGGRIGQASSMKMCYAAYTKGVSALMLNIAALATAEDIGASLAEEWGESQPEAMPRLMRAVNSTPSKAWRFEGEMMEMASAFQYHDLASGFAEGAAHVYHSIAGFKGRAPGDVDVAEVARRMLGWDEALGLNTGSGDGGNGGDGDGDVGGDASGKPKVLCLHGWRTSASIMKYQFRDFPADVEYVFVDACHPASGPPHGVVAAYFEPPFFEWWDKDDSNAYTGLDASLKYIADINRTQGPFVGVAGFSQGAALAVLLCAMMQHDRTTAPLPDLKFALLTSPFVPGDPSLAHLFKAPLTIPAFVSFGETDYIKSECERCVKSLPNAQVLVHTGGHEVPTKWNGKGVIAALATWLKQQLSTAS